MFPHNYLEPSFYDLNAYNAMGNASLQGTDGRAEEVQRSSPPPYRATTYENNSAAADWRRNRSSGSLMENQLRDTWQNHPPSPPVRAASFDTEWVGGHHGTAGTCSIRIVDGPDSYGRIIDCIAMVAKVSYEKAKQAAIDIYADYNPAEERMTFKNAKKVIRKLGLECERRFDDGKDWKDLPDLAIVAVGENGTRAVVFVRENGKEFICDSSNKEPVSPKDYPHKLDSGGAYIKIISQSHGGSGSSHVGGNSHYPVSHQPHDWHGSGHHNWDSHYPVSHQPDHWHGSGHHNWDSHYPVSHQGYGWHGSGQHSWDSHYPVSHQGYGWHGSSHLGGHSHYPVSHQPHDWHGSGHHSWHSHNHENSHNHETVGGHSIQVGGRTIQHVEGEEDGNGCVVASIASVANISYRKARSAAIDIVNFEPGGDGLNYKQAISILENFGIASSLHYYLDNKIEWSDLPDIALVPVFGPNGDEHSVVFVRSNGEEFIFDCNKTELKSCYDYEICPPGNVYIEIL